MKIQRLLIALTVVNIALLTFSVARPGAAGVESVAPVLRGRALEIVDDRGRVRASIAVLPADPTVKMPDGTTDPETVLLRSALEGDNVKLALPMRRPWLSAANQTRPMFRYSAGVSTSLKLSNRRAGRQTVAVRLITKPVRFRDQKCQPVEVDKSSTASARFSRSCNVIMTVDVTVTGISSASACHRNDDVAVENIVVAASHFEDVRHTAKLAQHFCAGPLIACHTRSVTAITGAAAGSECRPNTRTANIGSMLISGFDGQITTARNIGSIL
jgi:hypothetical protein